MLVFHDLFIFFKDEIRLIETLSTILCSVQSYDILCWNLEPY